MNKLLEHIDAGTLLQHVPANVRTSLETFERTGTDWNAVGNLLAATPTSGVAFRGTGQWTAELWQAVKWEFRSFVCTDSEAYAELRENWDELTRESSARAVASLATAIGSKVGIASGFLIPMVTWLVMVAQRTDRDAFCLTLSQPALKVSKS